MSDDGVRPFIFSELLKYSNDRILFINAGIDLIGKVDEMIELSNLPFYY